MYDIAERPTKAFEADFHSVSIAEADILAKAQRSGSEIMHMHVSGAAIEFEFEVMMFEIAKTMAHFCFTGTNGL